MIRFQKIMQNYLLYALPAVLLIMVWGSFQAEEQITAPLMRAAWEVLGWNIMLWFASLIVFLVSLVLVPQLRERTLTRLANIRERDEREEYITGRAARSSYISTMSLLIFLLFLSIFTVNIQKTPKAEGGNHGNVSLGLNFNLFEKSAEKKASDGVIFESSDLPISKPAILLSVLIWQIFSFSIPARRQSKESVA